MCVIFSVFPPRCPHASNSLSGIFFSPPLSSSLHLAFPLPVNPHCLIHSACVVSSIWPTDRTCITLLPRRNCHLNKSVLGGVISSICLVLPVFFLFFFQVTHVLNVAFGVNNLFPDQLAYKTVNILDVPDTDVTSHLGECQRFIDRAQEEVHKYTKFTL